MLITFSITTSILTAQANKTKTIWALIPIIGSLLFIALYIIAAFLYPGGYETNKTATGFSWTNNYWCNLLHDDAINGETNIGKPFAVTGLFILGIALSTFWVIFPKQIDANKSFGLIIPTSGMIAMPSAFLLVTDIDHDLVINFAGFFGSVATTGTIICLYRKKWFGLFAFGLFNILLIVLNNYLYHTKGMMIYLPVVQKISFLSFLVWICCIEMKLYRQILKTINI